MTKDDIQEILNVGRATLPLWAIYSHADEHETSVHVLGVE